MFGTKTVASVMAGFRKTVQDLNSIADASDKMSYTIENEIVSMSARKDAVELERDQARAIAVNINKMIEV